MFYESAQRLIKTLENIALEYGSETQISVGRELTKVFEEIKIGTVSEILDYYSKNVLKGEIVCMIYKHCTLEKDYSAEIKKLIDLKFSSKDVVLIIHALYGVDKNFIKGKFYLE